MANFNELMNLIEIMESTRLTREMDKKHDEHRAKLDGVNKKIESLEKILNDPSTSNTIKSKVNEKINKLKEEYNNGPAKHPLSISNGANYDVGAGHFATPKKAVEEYEFNLDSAKERKKMLKDKFYAKGIDPNTRKPGRFNMKESADGLKLEIYESCRAGEISKEERDTLLFMM